MKLTTGGSHSMWNSWSKYQKRSGIYKGDQQKSHIVQGLPILPWVFSRGVTHFYRSSLAMTFKFSRVSKTNLTSVLLVFFLEQTTDRKIELLFLVFRYPAQYTGLERLPPEPLQNKICYRLHPKYTSFSCFPIICLPAI